jgi:regulator of protease activity HflC (stomatin/prohibitin superfamily)
VYTTVTKYDCRVQASDVEAGAASKDLQTVNAKVTINWHPDPNKVQEIFKTIGDSDEVVQRVMRPVVNEIIKASTAQLTAEEVVSKRMVLKQTIDDAFKSRMTHYNILVDDLNIVHLDFSADFNKAIESKQVAEQKAKQAKYDADKAFQEGQALVNRAKGESEAQRLQVNTLNRTMILKMAVDKWDGHFPQVMGQGALPLLDLRQLQAKE